MAYHKEAGPLSTGLKIQAPQRQAAPQPEGSSVCAQQAPARLGFPGALPQRSRARTLEAGKRLARLAQARAASRPGLCVTLRDYR